MTLNKTEYELIIKPRKGIFSIDLRELLLYKELLFFLALREIKIRYKQTVMGASWAVLQPLFTMVVFTLIFGYLAKMPSEGIPYPIFSYSGVLLWIYFSNSVSGSATSLVGNSNLITKIYFPSLQSKRKPTKTDNMIFDIFQKRGISLIYLDTKRFFIEKFESYYKNLFSKVVYSYQFVPVRAGGLCYRIGYLSITDGVL